MNVCVYACMKEGGFEAKKVVEERENTWKNCYV